MAEIQTTGGSLGSTLSGAANLAQLFLGSSQNTTGTQTVTDNRTQTTSTSGGTNTTTTSTSVPPGAVDAVVKSILEGTSGLAAISSGQRTAGLYGSSTNQLLSNDLIARAASEGAKLNQTTTQTAVTAPTTTTTALSGGTTTASNQTATKKAPIDPRLAAGAIGLLQAIPKDVKDSVISRIMGTKTPGAAAAAGETGGASQQAIADAYNDPSRALDVAQGSGVGADGVASVGGVAGTGAPQIDGISLGVGGGDIDVGGLTDTDGLTNFLSANDNFSGVDVGGDYLNELGSGIGDALGGFASGIGDAASGVAESIGSFFDDFNFSFSDGGHVSREAKDSQLAEHFSKKVEEFYSKKSMPAYADGGGIGAVGDTRYGNTRGATDAKIKREMPRGNLFEETRTRNEQNAGLRSTGSEAMQDGSVPRTAVDPVSITSIIDNLPILVRAVLGNLQSESAARGKGVSGNVPSYANGGSVSKGDAYDLDTRDVSYLANTGLRAGNLRGVSTGSADSNDQFISRMLTDQLRGREANGSGSNIYNPGTVVRGARPQTDAAGANSSISQPVEAGEAGSAVGAGTTDGPVGNVGGLSGLGVSSAQASALGNVASAITGVPGIGTVAGLATSQNVAQSFAQTVAAAAATAALGPVGGLVASLLMNAFSSSQASGGGNNGIGGSSQGEGFSSASVSVGEATADDGTTTAGAPTGTSTTGIDGFDNSVSNSSNNGGDSNGDSAPGPGEGGGGTGGAGVGDGSGNAGGSDGEGGGYRSGGEISGKGTGVSDSILARVSDGEYIIPADVVEALGVPFFDKLRDKYHTPADQQKKG